MSGNTQKPSPVKEFVPDWACLSELRSRFLDTNSSHSLQNKDYWHSLHHLEQYDHTFARRIAWKWQSIVEEIQPSLESLLPSLEAVTDLGCGSGIAGEVLCTLLPAFQGKNWQLTDRSARARSYAKRKMLDLFQINCSEAAELKSLRPKQGVFYVASHMLTELDLDSWPHLLELLKQSSGFLFVEPGTKHASRRLVELRERLLENYAVLGPCFHQKACPLSAENADHLLEDWCHQALHPPSEVFQSRFWRDFSKQLGIDLRSLSSSWIFMVSKEKAPARQAEPQNPARLLGRAQVLKASVELRVCDSEGILKDYRLQKRDHAELFKLFKKGKMNSYLSSL